jgi:hypothetical protein
MDPPPLPIITHEHDLWFDDGSVVLYAETVGFRVHRSLLSKHCNVFKDMFDIGQPAPTDQIIEGCLVIQLHDSPDDLRRFLRLIYEPSSTT